MGLIRPSSRLWSRRNEGFALSSSTSAAPVVTIGKVKFGNDLPISIIAGPCQLESRQHALEVASALQEIAARLQIGLVYKTSFDKANRTSASAARGLGLAQSLPIFAEIQSSLGLPVLTDVHDAAQCAEGHGERRGQEHEREQSERARHRTRRLLRLQHAGLRHARLADPRAHHR